MHSFAFMQSEINSLLCFMFGVCNLIWHVPPYNCSLNRSSRGEMVTTACSTTVRMLCQMDTKMTSK